MPLTLRSDQSGTYGAIALDGTDRITVRTNGTVEFNATTTFNNVTLNATPSTGTDATNKNYVDGTALAMAIALG